MFMMEKIKMTDIKPTEYNPRMISDNELKKLKNSIENFGLVDPIIINLKNNTIIGGHQRYKALNKLGIESLNLIKLGGIGWCFVNDNIAKLDENYEKALNISLNKISGEWDEDKLCGLLENISFEDFDLSLTGFDEDEYDLLLEDTYGLDYDEEEYYDEEESSNILTDLDNVENDEGLDIETNIKKGDIYQLGNHRLMCGDSTEYNDVKLLMNGEQCDLVVTDPPYNVTYVGKTKDKLTIDNDSMDTSDFNLFITDVYNNYYKIMKDGCSIYVFYALSESINFIDCMENAGIEFICNCFWNKHSMVLGRWDYQSKFEGCIFGCKNKDKINWYGSDYESNVWYFKKPVANRLHPTMKPIDLICYPIRLSSKEKELVVDLFGGSGSTLLACEKTNRKCYTMEMSEKYCQVIINRWEECTGKKAIKINGE